MLKVIKANANSKEVMQICSRGASQTPEIEALVKQILEEVKKGGITAAIHFSKKFDGLKKSTIKLSEAEIKEIAAQTPSNLKSSLKQAIKNVKAFHKKQIEKSWQFTGKNGEVLGQRIRPLKRVGLYVPGGAGTYPSTLIMNAVPAIVAGVKELAVVTPGLQPSVAFAMLQLGIKEAYHIGGAQAIGLLAYGAESVERVDKIVGPGNVFAAFAKKEVFGTVDIDMIAGPSEIAVLADKTANPQWVAADMLSQAEHGSGFEAAICATDSEEFAKKLFECIKEQVNSSPKKEILKKSLGAFGRIFITKNMTEAVEIVNKIAPEHLEIVAKNEEKLAKMAVNAGAIFIGAYSTEPVGDYFAGPNHVLPTNGTARFASPLGVYSFLKRTSIIRYSKKALQKNAENIAKIANSEGFHHHAAAVLIRT